MPAFLYMYSRVKLCYTYGKKLTEDRCLALFRLIAWNHCLCWNYLVYIGIRTFLVLAIHSSLGSQSSLSLYISKKKSIGYFCEYIFFIHQGNCDLFFSYSKSLQHFSFIQRIFVLRTIWKQIYSESLLDNCLFLDEKNNNILFTRLFKNSNFLFFIM